MALDYGVPPWAFAPVPYLVAHQAYQALDCAEAEAVVVVEAALLGQVARLHQQIQQLQAAAAMAHAYLVDEAPFTQQTKENQLVLCCVEPD